MILKEVFILLTEVSLLPNLITLLLLLLFSSLCFAEDIVGGTCKAPVEFLKSPLSVDEIIEKIFVDVNVLDGYGKNIKFKAANIELGSNEIIFTDPRLNGRVINYHYSVCKKTKKNFFGYEVCQELKGVEVADKLCRELGLAGASDKQVNNGSEVVSNTQEPGTYHYDEGKWTYMKMWSALSPRIRFTRIQSLRCRLLK